MVRPPIEEPDGPRFLPICLIRSFVVQARMRSPCVVEGHPATEPLAILAAGLEGVQVDALVLQGAPQSLDHGVVHPEPLAIHGNAHAGVFENLGECMACELAPLIGI